jgi:type VI secretion system protein ImpF
MDTHSAPRLLPSLLDRLTIPAAGEEPIDGEPDRSRQLDRLRDQVKRDLEYLLNSRRAGADFPPERDHLNRSLLTFGLPDFADKSLGVLLGDELKQAVATAIRRFEPRLTDVRIEIDEDWKDTHAVRFHITALLNVEPEREPVTFDTLMALDTRTFEVQGGGG